MEHQMNQNKGFSLIELLLAITIMSIVLIMVTQFMSTTSGALTKTKKNLNLQTEVMEVGEQISDALMQATYIRVRTQDNTLYPLNTELNNTTKRRNRDDGTSTSTTVAITGDLVVDNYPNYINPADNDRDIILKADPDGTLDDTDYKLIDRDKNTYPLTGDTDSTSVHSFRILTSEPSGKQYYVIPEYIYIQYQKKAAGTEKSAYVIYHFDGNKVYIDRGDIDPTTVVADGFNAAVASVNAKTDNDGLLTESVSDCYFSANTDTNTVFLDMTFADKRYKYTYSYSEAVVLRNTNVLTVPPQKMYQYVAP